MKRKSEYLSVNIVMSNNLQTILSIQFDIFKHGEEEWNKIILVSKHCTFDVYICTYSHDVMIVPVRCCNVEENIK